MVEMLSEQSILTLFFIISLTQTSQYQWLIYLEKKFVHVLLYYSTEIKSRTEASRLICDSPEQPNR